MLALISCSLWWEERWSGPLVVFLGATRVHEPTKAVVLLGRDSEVSPARLVAVPVRERETL